jgi:hypothetical protein
MLSFTDLPADFLSGSRYRLLDLDAASSPSTYQEHCAHHLIDLCDQLYRRRPRRIMGQRALGQVICGRRT